VGKTYPPLKNELKGKEVIHSPGPPLLAERRRSGAMDNFHHQEGIKKTKITHSICRRPSIIKEI